MSINFSGFNIHAKDPFKSLEFYGGLGLSIEEEPDDNGEAVLKWGEHTALWIWHDESENNNVNKKRMTIEIVAHCADINKSYSELKNAGYDINESELMSYGGKEMYLFDPDGNKILFLD